MRQQTVLITGANGGIGQVLCTNFRKAGWRVIASDQGDANQSTADTYVAVELTRLCRDTGYRAKSILQLRDELGKTGLHALINNAATQILAPVEQLTADNWHTSMDTNLLAPFLLSQAMLANLQKTGGQS